MAMAAGKAVLVYLVLSGRLCGDGNGGARTEDRLISSAVSTAAAARARLKEEARARHRRREEQALAWRRWPERAPGGWGEAADVAARSVGAHLRDQVLRAAADCNWCTGRACGTRRASAMGPPTSPCSRARASPGPRPPVRCSSSSSDSFDACFTSPLARYELIPGSDLREIDLYSFQGLLKSKGKKRYGVLFGQ